eukprot:gene4165-3006_t
MVVCLLFFCMWFRYAVVVAMQVKNQIRRLDASSSRLLGAGQAITGVPSVVKEALENSLDAGARHVLIRLVRFGLDSIRVEDDGSGIAVVPPEELPGLVAHGGAGAEGLRTALLESRCTSKRSPSTPAATRTAASSLPSAESEEDEMPEWLGFRGEALHALAQVSRVALETRHASFRPFTVRCEYDPASAAAAAAGCALPHGSYCRSDAADGLGLFEVLPVRRRDAEKHRQAHLQQAVALVKQYAVSHPWLQLRLTHQEAPPDGQTATLVTLRGDSSFTGAPHPSVWWRPALLSRAIGDAYGGGAVARLGEVAWVLRQAMEEVESVVHVRGFVWRLEAGGRSTGDWRVWVVDGRVMDLPRWTRAVESAYRSCLPHAQQSRHAAFFLHVWSDGGAGLRYDVNLAPDKRQALVVDEQAWADALHQAARQTFWGWSEGVREMVERSSALLSRESRSTTLPANPTPLPAGQAFSLVPSDLLDTNAEAEEAALRMAHRMETHNERERQQRQLEAAQRRDRAALNFTSYVWRGDDSGAVNESPQPLPTPSRDAALRLPPDLRVEVVYDTGRCGDDGSGRLQLPMPMPGIRSLWRRRPAAPSTAAPASPRLGSSRKRRRGADAGAGLAAQDGTTLEQLFSKASFLEMAVHGQFNMGFIICSVPAPSGSVLMVVDQHASDEKANYEQLVRAYAPRPQPLVIPVVLSLDAEEVRLGLEHRDVLQRQHGFQVSAVEQIVDGEVRLNPTRLRVLAVPTLPYDTVHPTAITELLQHLHRYGTLTTTSTSTSTSGGAPPPIQLRAVWHSLATKACRSSIMIGTALQQHEMERIVRRLSTLRHPWSCPHGRPTLRCLGDVADWTDEMPSRKRDTLNMETAAPALAVLPKGRRRSDMGAPASAYTDPSTAAAFVGFHLQCPPLFPVSSSTEPMDRTAPCVPHSSYNLSCPCSPCAALLPPPFSIDPCLYQPYLYPCTRQVLLSYQYHQSKAMSEAYTPKPKEGAGQSAAPARKRPRPAVLAAPFQRQLYEMIVRQLQHDGFVSAASTVADAASVCLGGSLRAGVEGDRLERLTAEGLLAETLQRRELDERRATHVVERYISASKLYVPLHLANAWHMGSKLSHWREKFATSALGGVVRDACFSADGAYAGCAGTNGLALILSLRTLEDVVAVERARSANQYRGQDWAQAAGRPQAVPNANEITDLAVARRIPGFSQSCETIRFHPDQPLVVCGSRAGELAIYNVEPADVQLQVKVPTENYPVRTAAWHPSGKYVIYGTDNPVPRLLSVEMGTVMLAPQIGTRPGAEGAEVATQQHTAGLTAVAFSPDGRTWGSASLDGSWALCDGSSGKVIHKVPSGHSRVPVTSLTYSRTGNIILTGGMDSTARLWDLRYIARSTAAAHSSSSAGAPHPRSGPGSSGEVLSFGAPGKCEHRSIRAVFSSDESHVLCPDAELSTIHGYCVYSGDPIFSLVTEPRLIQRALACSPYGNTVLTGGDDCRLRLWTPSWVASV